VPDWLLEVFKLAGAALGGGGVWAAMRAFARRPANKAEAADRLNDSTLEWAQALQADAREARTEAAAARREATEAHSQMRAVREEAEKLAAELRMLRTAILDPRAVTDPQAALERLRAMVTGG
jgi:hypothetical protein